MNGTNKNEGFTLVEILIVVVILGILAALVIPEFGNASDQAKSSNLASQLQTLRGQIELYKLQHSSFPTLVQLWGNLTSKTTVAGVVDAAGTYGPYLKKAPVNPYTNSSTVKAAGAGTATDGWEYNATTGELNAVGFNETTLTYTAPSSN